MIDGGITQGQNWELSPPIFLQISILIVQMFLLWLKRYQEIPWIMDSAHEAFADDGRNCQIPGLPTHYCLKNICQLFQIHQISIA